MTAPRDPEIQQILDRLLEVNGLAPDAWLYREVMRESLAPGVSPGHHRLRANPHPRDMVVDVYGTGRVVDAETVGPGLTFAMTWAHSWQETMELRVAFAAGDAPVDKVGVRVRVADLLAQGGLLYPVHSVASERAWYCTLPEGTVDVEAMG